MTPTEKRIHDAVLAFNPLQDDLFCDELKRSYLKHDSNNMPRVYSHMRMVADIWTAKDKAMGVIEAVEHSRAAEPNFHALIADSVSVLKNGANPVWHRVHHLAENCMHVLRNRRYDEIGFEEAVAEFRQEYLLAIERLTATGFTGEALTSLAYISGLAKARRA